METTWYRNASLADRLRNGTRDTRPPGGLINMKDRYRKAGGTVPLVVASTIVSTDNMLSIVCCSPWGIPGPKTIGPAQQVKSLYLHEVITQKCLST